MMAPRICSVGDCGRAHRRNGLCDMHDQRQKRTGTTDSPVRSLAERFWAMVDRGEPDECWLWTGAKKAGGYGVMRPAGKRTGPTVKAHRVSLELAGVDIAGKIVRHKCDNPPCVNPHHLETGTHADNIADALSRGRIPLGSARTTSKLTEEQVQEIRHLRSLGLQYKEIVPRFGVTSGTVGHIIRGSTWSHLPVTPPAARDLVATVVEALS